MARRLLTALLAAAALAAALPAPAPAATPATTLPLIERQVMCVTCKIPLNVAESPQADRERAYIQELIDEGKDEAQVKSALVGQYGQAVLGLPAAHGFDLTAYIVPVLVLAALLVLLAVMLPRWRRRSREEPAGDRAPGLSAADSARLDSDLARYDRSA